MHPLIISPTARQDLSDIFDYIARDKPIAASNWIETIEQKHLHREIIRFLSHSQRFVWWSPPLTKEQASNHHPLY
ncbi:MAG: type II toxin-antitoxin system RelE/ParE family toxin [Pirellulales bacterium]